MLTLHAKKQREVGKDSFVNKTIIIRYLYYQYKIYKLQNTSLSDYKYNKGEGKKSPLLNSSNLLIFQIPI